MNKLDRILSNLVILIVLFMNLSIFFIDGRGITLPDILIVTSIIIFFFIVKVKMKDLVIYLFLILIPLISGIFSISGISFLKSLSAFLVYSLYIFFSYEYGKSHPRFSQAFIDKFVTS